jgi:hypothetical protein
MRLPASLFPLLLAAACVPALPGGCAPPYSITSKPFSRDRFNTLTRSVVLAREAQAAALAELAAAGPALAAGIASDDLDAAYRESQRTIARCESRVTKSGNRVTNVKDNAGLIFEEWKRAVSECKDAPLRAQSQRELDEARARADRLMDVLGRAESAMTPVMQGLRNDARYLGDRRVVRDVPRPSYCDPAARELAMGHLRAEVAEAADECDVFTASFPGTTAAPP